MQTQSINFFYSLISDVLINTFELKTDQLQILLEQGSICTYKKNQVLKAFDEPENQIRMILSGTGGYFIMKKNEEVCFYFAFPGNVFLDYKSLITQNPGNIALKALERIVTFEISREKFLQFTESISNGEQLRRKGAELLYFETQDYYIELLSLTAAERYKLLLERFNGITQLIDHKNIASFLGITPQSLSRLRKSLLKEK